jgi:hypothetical protein
MEARGVEPLSENIATQASTGVVVGLMSPEVALYNKVLLRSA